MSATSNTNMKRKCTSPEPAQMKKICKPSSSTPIKVEHTSLTNDGMFGPANDTQGTFERRIDERFYGQFPREWFEPATSTDDEDGSIEIVREVSSADAMCELKASLAKTESRLDALQEINTDLEMERSALVRKLNDSEAAQQQAHIEHNKSLANVIAINDDLKERVCGLLWDINKVTRKNKHDIEAKDEEIRILESELTYWRNAKERLEAVNIDYAGESNIQRREIHNLRRLLGELSSKKSLATRRAQPRTNQAMNKSF